MEENNLPQQALKPETPPQPEPVIAQKPINMAPKKQSPVLMLLVIIIALTAICFAGYFGYENYMLKNQKIVSPPPPEPPIRPTDVPDPTANWDKYTNPVDNFSFKYPSTWTIDIKGEMGGGRKENIMIGLTKNQAKISIYANMVGIGGLGQDYEGSAIVLDGNNLFLYKKTNTFDKTQMAGITDTLTQSLGVFKIGEKTYSIMLAYPLSYTQTEASDLEKEFTQILSTFKFNGNNETFVCPDQKTIDCTPCTGKMCPMYYPMYCAKGSAYYNWIKANCPEVLITGLDQ